MSVDTSFCLGGKQRPAIAVLGWEGAREGGSFPWVHLCVHENNQEREQAWRCQKERTNCQSQVLEEVKGRRS